jgi:hypothetical protein
VKDLSSGRAALALLAPVFLILALVMISNMRVAVAAKVPDGDGTIQLAFIGSVVQVDGDDTPITDPPPLPYQHVYLNVLGVRLNPNVGAAEGDKNWVTIPVPVLKGIGNKAGTSQLSIDLTQIGQLATFFNNAFVKANKKNQTYTEAELLLNSANPGSIVPLCSALPSPGEGCTAYPIAFPPGSPSSIRASLIGSDGNPSAGLRLAKLAVVPLVLDITLDVQSPPSVTGNQVTVFAPTIEVIPNTLVQLPSTATPKVTPTPVAVNPYMALVTGKVTGKNGSNTVINVEPTGTSDLVSPINPFNLFSDGTYNLYLPVLPGGSTAYDFYASARDRSFAIYSDITVSPLIPTTLNFTQTTHSSQPVKGSLIDACNGGVPPGLQNATLKILEPFIPSVSPTPTPGKGSPTPTPAPTPDCGAIPATDCVVVATAITNSGGSFPTPVPGRSSNLAAFSAIPVVPEGFNYTLIVDAPGFDRTVVPLVKPKNSGILTCVGTQNKKDKSICDLALSHGYLNGALNLGAVTPTDLTAQVVAEDRGTNELENTIIVPVPAGQSAASFPGSGLYIPDQADPRYADDLLTGIDLYALIDDDLSGVTQSNTGHSIPVEAGLPVPEACSTAVVEASLNDTTCVGHGSIEGSFSASTTGTTAVLEKPDPNLPSDLIQLISGGAGPYGNNGGSGYALCAPADDYFLQRFDNGVPSPPTPVALATPELVPASGATPCPSICDAGQSGACLVCTNTEGPNL